MVVVSAQVRAFFDVRCCSCVSVLFRCRAMVKTVLASLPDGGFIACWKWGSHVSRRVFLVGRVVGSAVQLHFPFSPMQQVEAELNGLDKEEAAEYLEALGVQEGGLKSLIR